MFARRTLLALAGLAAIGFAGSAEAQQTLRVGSTPTGVPFTFLNTQNNQIEGIMVDIVKALGKVEGFEVKIEPMQFSTLIDTLKSNRIDVIAAAMFITEARSKVVDFSDPIVTYGDGLFVPKSDTTEYKDISGLKGKAVGAQLGTTFVGQLQGAGIFSEVKIYDTLPDVLRDVNAGRIAGGVADEPIVAYNIKQGHFPNVRLVKGYKPIALGSVGLGVRKGDAELLKKLNSGLAKMKADGSLKAILTKWGLEG